MCILALPMDLCHVYRPLLLYMLLCPNKITHCSKVKKKKRNVHFSLAFHIFLLGCTFESCYVHSIRTDCFSYTGRMVSKKSENVHTSLLIITPLTFSI